jgi:SsrA-binding protein
MASKQSDKNNRVLAVNKQARRLYAIDDTFVAGLVLMGSEVKSLRAGHVTVGDGFIEPTNGELFLAKVHIKEYQFSNRHGHEPMRRRKLLLQEREIRQVTRAIREKGCTCVPMKFFIKNGYIKLEIGIGKGKKLHDRRSDLKERDSKREMDRAMRK